MSNNVKKDPIPSTSTQPPSFENDALGFVYKSLSEYLNLHNL